MNEPKRTKRWTRTVEDRYLSEQLLLPSFDISVTRSTPSLRIYPPDPPDLSLDLEPDSADAFSASYVAPHGGISLADQDFLRLDPGYLRRILLRILDAEESQKVAKHHYNLKHWGLPPDFPKGQKPGFMDYEIVRDPEPRSQVRISDLRLVTELRMKHFERTLKQTLPSLNLPVTKDSVTRWKLETCKVPSEQAEGQQEEIATTAVAVSFAAAAILLLRDLGVKDVKATTTHTVLQEKIVTLAKVIAALSKGLDKSVEEFSALLADTKGEGRPPDPEAKYYLALVLYRLGHRPTDIARSIGINPREPGDSSGSKDWQRRLDEAVKRGVKIEELKFPHAVALIARGDENEEHVKTHAYYAYTEYLRRSEEENEIYWKDVGRNLVPGIPVDEDQEMHMAFIQLGSCLANGREPIPTTVT